MSKEIQKGLIIFLLLFCCATITFVWYLADKQIQLEKEIKLLRIETHFLTNSIQTDLEVMEANLIRLKKGQW